MIQLPLGLSDSFQIYLADTAALAAVALIGYLFGQRSRKSAGDQGADDQLRVEVSRATAVARELQEITQRIRNDVAYHQTNISQFKARLSKLPEAADSDGWHALSNEAETLLAPTMKLATDLSMAYDELRKQSALLMNFAGSRTDPHTGLSNRRAMEEQLEVLLALHQQNQVRFSATLLSVDCGPEEMDCAQVFGDFARLLEATARDTDIVARYSTEEFMVVMPQTSLAGATIFSERLVRRAGSDINCVVCGGIVEVQTGEDAEGLLSRADSALYSARSRGNSSLYQHNGKTIRPHEMELEPIEACPSSEPQVAATQDADEDSTEPCSTSAAVEC